MQLYRLIKAKSALGMNSLNVISDLPCLGSQDRCMLHIGVPGLSCFDANCEILEEIMQPAKLCLCSNKSLHTINTHLIFTDRQALTVLNTYPLLNWMITFF